MNRLLTPALLVLLSTLLALVGGCHDDARPPGGSGNNGGVTNNGMNNGTNNGSNNATEAFPIVFTLANTGDGPVYVQASDFGGNPTWFELSDSRGETVQVHDGCGPCVCGDLNCPVCERAEARVEAVEAGQSRSWTWDGGIWINGTNPDGTVCRSPEVAARGVYNVKLCSGTRYSEDGGDQWVAAPTCADVRFEVGVDREVRAEVVGPRQAAMEFELTNGGSAPVYLQDWSLYGSRWLSLFTEETALGPSAMACLCDCAVPDCDIECPVILGTVAEVGPQASQVFAWDGVDHRTEYPEGGLGACQAAERVEATQLNAVMCWGAGVLAINSGDVIIDPLCHTIAFDREPGAFVNYETREAAVELSFVNTTDTTLYVQTGNDLGWPEWWHVASAGRRLQPMENCGVCECFEAGGCAVCGQALPIVQAVAPGESITTMWRGQTWESLPRCEYPVVVNEGVLEAELCWGTGWQGEVGPDDQTLFGEATGVTCRTAGFVMGRDGEVSVSPE